VPGVRPGGGLFRPDRARELLTCCPGACILTSISLVGQTDGGMSEWFKEAVLKTVVPKGTVGSNPTPSATDFLFS
jgi:hypothetical protein